MGFRDTEALMRACNAEIQTMHREHRSLVLTLEVWSRTHRAGTQGSVEGHTDQLALLFLKGIHQAGFGRWENIHIYCCQNPPWAVWWEASHIGRVHCCPNSHRPLTSVLPGSPLEMENVALRILKDGLEPNQPLAFHHSPAPSYVLLVPGNDRLLMF